MTDHNTTAVPIVDAHLDLAENVLFCGRDLTLTVQEIRDRERRTNEQATVTLPELRQGGVAIVFATIFAGVSKDLVSPAKASEPDVFSSAEEAEANGLAQIELYESWEKQGLVRLVKSVADLEDHLRLWADDRKPGLLMLMEGADPIVSPCDLPKWWRLGVRMVGLTWDSTRYGTGVGAGHATFKRGLLTPDGVDLLKGMAETGMIWDVSHLAEDGVRQGLEMQCPRCCASHSNVQAITPTDRQLPDDIIRAIADRDGVIGLNLCNDFLDPRCETDKSISISLDQVRRHAEHMAAIGGWKIVGIGSDLDGGVGLEESPVEINTIADLHKLGSIAPADYHDDVLGGNWLRFLRAALPA